MSSAIYYVFMATLTMIVVFLATSTNMLRDTNSADNSTADDASNSEATESAPAPPPPNKDKKPSRPPFSLARAQFAFWTVIIFSSFMYILFKHNYQIPAINNVNLILLGIVVSTSASAKLIDESQKKNGNLNSDYPSEGFLIDILSDKKGVSIHRLQNVLWTLAVGLIYIHYVANESSLPDETVISDNLLLLMGISTGAYLGIKTTENSK